VIYQAFKYFDPNRASIDAASWLVFSNTIQLAIGLSFILQIGKQTNELQGLGFEHMLRVKQAEQQCKSSHFLVEHSLWLEPVKLRRSYSDGDRTLREAIGALPTEHQLDATSPRQGATSSKDSSMISLPIMTPEGADMTTWLAENSNSLGKDPITGRLKIPERLKKDSAQTQYEHYMAAKQWRLLESLLGALLLIGIGTPCVLRGCPSHQRGRCPCLQKQSRPSTGQASAPTVRDSQCRCNGLCTLNS
jgi:hypothetical protein